MAIQPYNEINDFFICDTCGLVYEHKVWSQRCECWCLENMTFDLETTITYPIEL